MSRFSHIAVFILSVFTALTVVGCGVPEPTEEPAEPVARSTSYDDLLALFEEWREFQKPDVTEGVPDYTRAAMERKRSELVGYRNRLAAIDPSSWPVSQQVDYHIVRAEMNGLEFDHRVIRPWARDPSFYVAFYEGPTDVPAREGPEIHGALLLWTYTFPLNDDALAQFQMKLRAIPRLLEQAKQNLTEDAKDLFYLGIRVKQRESLVLAELAERLAEHHPELVADVENAKDAVDDFRAWLEERHRTMTASSGIGVDNYNWYMKNVHLVPYTWEEQRAIMQRELDRSWAHLKLVEARNRRLPPLEPPADEEEMQRRFQRAVDTIMAFIREEQIFTVPDYMSATLRGHGGSFTPPHQLRDFFTQVDHHDSLPMRTHGTHWFDLARMEREPHPSPIRRSALLYNIWDSRAEGLATGFEEMAMHAGLFDDNPRAKELIYILLAMRCARGMGDLMMHANQWTVEEAVDYAVKWTPRQWLSAEGSTIWFDERLYLQQPGYGTSYVIGKVHIEKLIADRANQLGADFVLGEFMDAFHDKGMIPVSLIRWEMTGLTDETVELW